MKHKTHCNEKLAQQEFGHNIKCGIEITFLTKCVCNRIKSFEKSTKTFMLAHKLV